MKVRDIPGVESTYSEFTEAWAVQYALPGLPHITRSVGQVARDLHGWHATLLVRPGEALEIGDPAQSAQHALQALMDLEVSLQQETSAAIGDFLAIVPTPGAAADRRPAQRG